MGNIYNIGNTEKLKQMRSALKELLDLTYNPEICRIIQKDSKMKTTQFNAQACHNIYNVEDKAEIITPEEFEAKAKSFTGDPHDAHSQMDVLMEETLKSLGYEKGIKIIADQERWYE